MRIILGLCLILVAFSLCTKDRTHPLDADLERVFFKHAGELDRLVEMSKRDSKLTRIASDFTTTEDRTQWPCPETELGFSQARWGEYRQLFSQTGLEGGFWRRPGSDDRYFIASAKGLATGGSMKGYVYSVQDLKPQVDSLDKVSPVVLQSSPNKTAYKKIREGWYLFYEAN